VQFRFRALKGRVDLSSFWAQYRAQHLQDRKDLKENVISVWAFLGPFAILYLLPLAAFLRLFGIFGAVFSGSKEVEAREGEGGLAELEGLLRRGQLKPTDLVYADGGWQTFRHSMAFEDVCIELEQQSRPFRLAASGLSILCGVALLMGMGWAIFTVPDWILAAAR
jgi:hypothetical protein